MKPTGSLDLILTFSRIDLTAPVRRSVGEAQVGTAWKDLKEYKNGCGRKNHGNIDDNDMQ